MPPPIQADDESMKRFLEAQGKRYAPPTDPETPAQAAGANQWLAGAAPQPLAQPPVPPPANSVSSMPAPAPETDAPKSGWGSMPNPGAMMPPATPAGQSPGVQLPGFGAAGMTADQLERANGPQTMTGDEAMKAAVAKGGGAMENVGQNRWAPPGMSRFEADARYDKGEGLRKYLMQGSERGDGAGLSPQERIALTASYGALQKGYDDGDKLDLDRYTGIARANDASLQTGIAQRGATTGERGMALAEKKGAYDMSRSLQEEKFYDSMKALGKTDAEAMASIQMRRRSMPGGNGVSAGNAPPGASAGLPGAPAGPVDPMAPAVPDAMKYADLFGSDAHAAAEAAAAQKGATVGNTAATLFRNMKSQPGGEQKFASNMDQVQKYLGLKFTDRDVDKYINPGRWSQSMSAVGNSFGKPSDEEILQSMMRDHNAKYGTGDQQKSAAKSQGLRVKKGLGHYIGLPGLSEN